MRPLPAATRARRERRFGRRWVAEALYPHPDGPWFFVSRTWTLRGARLDLETFVELIAEKNAQEDRPLGGWEEGRGLIPREVVELSDRLDAIRSAEMMGAPERWPLGGVLPVKREAPAREGPGSLYEHGHLLHGPDFRVRPWVYVEDREEPVAYSDFEAITNDGWRVD